VKRREEILLETSGNQRTWSSISGWEQWPRAVATSPGIVPELESADQPDGNVISWNLGPMHPSLHGAAIHCADNAERSCGSPATGGAYT